jgi:hypothetical protein
MPIVMPMKVYFRQRFNRFPSYWICQGVLIVWFSHGVLLKAVHAQQFSEAPLEEPAPPQVIKFKLNDLSGVSEWIRAEVSGNQIQIVHTVVSQSGLSKALTRFSPIPIAHTWHDHPTSRIVFRPQGCDRDDCLISGTKSIILPANITPYQGEFLLEYQESGWTRTVLFKLPSSNPTPSVLSEKSTQRTIPC